MKPKPKILLFLGCFCVLSLQAQQNKKLDSLLKKYESQKEDTLKVNTLAVLYNTFLYNDQEKAKEYALEQLSLSEKIDFKKGVARSLYHIGVYFNNIDQIDSARTYYNKSLNKFIEIEDIAGQVGVNHGIAILEYSLGEYDSALGLLDKNIGLYQTKLNDSSGLAISYDLKGTINTYKGNHRIALAETLKALKILEKIDKPIRKADALNHLASIEFFLDNYKKANEYNFQALKIYKKFNDKYYEAQVLNDIGNTYFYLDNYKEAINYLEQSILLSREMNVQDIEATSINNLGKTYTKLGQFDKAISNLNQGLILVEKTKSTNKIVEALNNLGMAYNQMNQPEKALSYFNRGILIADTIGVKENQRIGYYNRSLSHEKMNAYKASLYDYRKYKSISDSILNTTKSQQIEELRTIYETEKKEQEIALQKNEIDLLEQKAEINNLQRLLLGVGLLLSLIGFYALRQKMKRNRLEKEKVDAELEFKKKELTTHALHLAKKNETLESLKQKAEELKEGENGQGYKQLIQTINFDLQDDNNWENFAKYFEEVHTDFNSTVKNKFPEVTSNELRLMSLLKMNLSSKEIANILNISQEGIKKARYRLRKKLGITTEDSLEALVMQL